MYKCINCECEFSDNRDRDLSEFYKFVTDQPGYYPGKRWEYDIVNSKILSAPSISKKNLLDVGCGSGLYLEGLLSQQNMELVGIDTCIKSIAMCRQKGINSYPTSLNAQFIASNIGSFDYVTSFHCLEHVSDPLFYLTQITKLLKPNGIAFVSTPLSPLLNEIVSFDPLNNPPHHLTRFTEISVLKLASMLDLNVSIILSPRRSYLKCLLSTYRSGSLGSPYVPRSILCREIFLNPFRFLKFSAGLIRSGKLQLPGLRSDTILAIFTGKQGLPTL
jgi:SAM-dependent methyltransferase